MYIADLTALESGHVAVGWLHPDHAFPKGKVAAEFVARIEAFAARWGDSIKALDWGAAGGVHFCEFCKKAHASGTFGVLSRDRVYYVPEMIDHYINAHEYAPPDEFIAAVLTCPLPGSPEYESAARPLAVLSHLRVLERSTAAALVRFRDGDAYALRVISTMHVEAGGNIVAEVLQSVSTTSSNAVPVGGVMDFLLAEVAEVTLPQRGKF